jgi:hypothetical protein
MRELAKHDSPRISTELGMHINAIRQYWKLDFPIRVSHDPDSKLNISMLTGSVASPAKQASPRVWTERGTHMSFNKHDSKQRSPISSSCESPSNFNVPIFALQKERLPSPSIARGIEIDVIEQREKHDSSTKRNREPDSHAMRTTFALKKQ